MAVCAVNACSPADGSSGAVEVIDSAGATIVVSHGPRWADGAGWSVPSEPRVTIGVFDGTKEYELFNVRAAARQSDGDFVVVDGGTREVRLYDRDGTYIRAFGGYGSGPGEFRNPTQVLVSGFDDVVVWDDAIFRITRFDSAGSLVSVRSVDRGQIAKAIEPPLYPGMGHLVQDDLVLIRLVEKTGKGVGSGVSRRRSGAFRVSADVSRVDTLMFFGDNEEVSVESPWGRTLVAPPLARTTVMAVQPALSEVCLGDQARPEITCFGPDGSRTVIRWESESEPVREEEVAAWLEKTVDLWSTKVSEDIARRTLAQVVPPETRPHYSRVTLDRVGNLWVERGRVEPLSESVEHLVFDPSGALLGVVALPPMEILDIGEDYIMGIHRDELDIEYVQMFDIVK